MLETIKKHIPKSNEITSVKQAIEIAGSLGKPSKMPCRTWNISATHCITGGKLTNVKNSVCEGCYALKGQYIQFAHSFIPASEKRIKAIDNPLWVKAMAFLILNESQKSINVFRWFDSGDLQSRNHLEKIAHIARLTPNVKHWLPTREYKIVNDYMSRNIKPDNLNIRLSVHMVDAKPIANKWDLPTSNVITKKPDYNTFICKAPEQINPKTQKKNFCLDCRACWAPKIKNVSYWKH